jgi:hypothetical protein
MKSDRKPNKKHDALDEKDLALLREFGFKRATVSSAKLNERKIDDFGMRQLDRLKLLLLRNESRIGGYPVPMRGGIEKNDLRSFAEALALLSIAFIDSL